MAPLNRDSIDTFISITGVPESIAVQRLEACGGNLSEAIYIHFSEGDRNRVQESPATLTAPPSDFMDIDDSFGMEHQGPSFVSQPGEGSGIPVDDDRIARDLRGNQLPASNDVPSAPQFEDTTVYENDIEEEMVRAAIEASKRDANMENEQRELGHKAETSGSNVHEPAEMEKRGKIDKSTGRRRGASASDKRLRQRKKEAGSSSIQNDIIETNEHSLARHGDRSSGSEDAHREAGEAEVRPVVGPSRSANSSLTQPNGNAFPSDEWGGISSEEHDEAVMLEAAMFGGVPENGYPLLYAPSRFTRSRLNTWQSPRPPSPTLVAQRTIRERQDGEYFAALQADREKELRAMEEEKAAKEAALLEQRKKEEESQRKLVEEQELERQLAAKEASLPEEPPLEDESAVNLLVRMPNGSRRGRRFHKTDRLEFLFDFIDIGRGVKPGTYRLVRPYPRRAFSGEEKSSTLSELGLTSKQEALFLEII